MIYTINELAKLSKVTTRTLRYYDQLGLLTPAQIGQNGYRYYNRENLLRLQQILFFRELDVPLKDIRNIIDRPDYDLVEALQQHRDALKQRAERVKTLIETIDETIASFKGEWIMSEKDYFEGFDENQYAEEAQQRWGNTRQYAESQRKWGSYSKQEKETIKVKSGEITVRMVGKDTNKPDDPEIQTAVAEYHALINDYFYSCDVTFMRGLADMWEADPRFAANYEKIREGGAAFVKQAVYIYCEQNKS
ncbi:MAG: MerR family transcriptional regulator [Anaerolineaceae bacterium]|nr:MerR family transcriptional regulator [Anaerolineaceae bacterium]